MWLVLMDRKVLLAQRVQRARLALKGRKVR
jgi:hypothetical protein